MGAMRARDTQAGQEGDAMLRRLWDRWTASGRDESGQALVEYGLIIGLIAVVVMGLLVTLGGQLQGFFQKIVTTLGG